ncbi:hypothetical protein [Salinibaculum rarum]|uniref:hypothetical protein n=1 Tax=Salinibaculum rarum TaxID=3058903 RepID=UPI00265DB725|nr:hypothetical protein [Salinibaculum sp. KK48]
MPAALRERAIDSLYDALADLREANGGMHTLNECSGRMDWPERGVYFFFSPDTDPEAPACNWRVTRVGTIGLREGSNNTLWTRLRRHRGPIGGQYEGGGNHRGSVFRKHVGHALLNRYNLDDECDTWGEGYATPPELRREEQAVEELVSSYVRDLPFIIVAVPDATGQDSDRGYIESNTIGLLSNYADEAVDRRKDHWLGHDSHREEIADSGLWNVRHVGEEFDPGVVETLRAYTAETTPP